MTNIQKRDSNSFVNPAEADIQEIYLGNLGTVDANIQLPNTGHRGSEFIWSSDDKLYLSDDGTVTRPLPGVGNRHIHLTVKAKLNKNQSSKIFDVTVLEQETTFEVVRVEDVACDVMNGKDAHPSNVAVAERADGSYSTLPVQWQPVSEANATTSNNTTGSQNNYILNGTAYDNEKTFPVKAIITKHTIDNRVEDLHRARLSRLGNRPIKATLIQDSDLAYIAQEMSEYLLGVDDDHILVNFRMAAGIDTHAASVMTGWDAPDSKLRGHTTGHYLSALSLAYQCTNNNRFKQKIHYLVSALMECQKQLHLKKNCEEGFLAAYDERPFELLEEGAHYPDVWAPYYTQDKILSGLLDAYEYGQESQALSVASGMGTWIANRLKRLSPKHRATMWATYIAGEFGGLCSALVRLYRFTGNSTFAETATYLHNDKLLYPMSRDVDTLAGMHANQHIPQVTGALDLFTYADDLEMGGSLPAYSTSFQAAQHFWEICVKHHTFCQGGIGETEMIRKPDEEAGNITDKSAENCASYSMMKLTQGLFESTPNSRYTNYYARVLRNHITATFSRKKDGGSTYFFPLRPGGICTYDTSENTCCHGSGLENAFRFQSMIATETCQGHDVRINLYIPALLQGTAGSFKLEKVISNQQSGRRIVFSLSIRRPGNFLIRLRYPDYATAFSLNIKHANGKSEEKDNVEPDSDGYVSIECSWETDDMILISWVPLFRVHHCPDDPEIISLAYGPDVMAAISDKQDFLEVEPSHVKAAVELNHRQWIDQGKVTVDGITWMPINKVAGHRFHAYVKLSNDHDRG